MAAHPQPNPLWHLRQEMALAAHGSTASQGPHTQARTLRLGLSCPIHWGGRAPELAHGLPTRLPTPTIMTQATCIHKKAPKPELFHLAGLPSESVAHLSSHTEPPLWPRTSSSKSSATSPLPVSSLLTSCGRRPCKRTCKHGFMSGLREHGHACPLPTCGAPEQASAQPDRTVSKANPGNARASMRAPC